MAIAQSPKMKQSRQGDTVGTNDDTTAYTSSGLAQVIVEKSQDQRDISGTSHTVIACTRSGMDLNDGFNESTKH